MNRVTPCLPKNITCSGAGAVAMVASIVPFIMKMCRSRNGRIFWAVKSRASHNLPLRRIYPSGAKDAHFFNDVYAIVRQVPKGRVTTYGAIAAALGARSAARMVGWAMNAAHTVPDVPAQRVVNRTGLLSGKMHFETPTRMQELLEQDGVVVKDDQVQHFETLFWDPVQELKF